MKIVIFAGGSGTRLWPLSRKKSPKQFEKMINNKSTLQITVEKLLKGFSSNDIYITTNIIYKNKVYKQLPEIPKKNFIFEPEKKDVGPAICLVMGIFSKIFPKEPVAILWSDHIFKKTEIFLKLLKTAGDYIKKNPQKIIFIGHNPRFPNTNLGYIKIDIKKEEKYQNIVLKKFAGFKYKPDLKTASSYIKSKKYVWNLGYFITTPIFLFNQYRTLTPKLYYLIKEIIESKNTNEFKEKLNNLYQKIEPISFDHAIAERIDKNNVLVTIGNIEWSDIGTWESLKEALQKNPNENITLGNVYLKNIIDSLIYNYENRKKIIALDLEKIILVNTKDVLLITKKESVGKLSQLIKSFEGTENEKLI